MTRSSEQAQVRFSHPYRWIILLLAMLIQVGVSLLQQAPAALGPVLIRDLGLARSQVGLLYASTFGGMILATLPIGVLIDQHGERWLIVCGASAMCFLTLLASKSNSFLLLFTFLFLAGIGGASSSPGGTKAISAWFPRREWGMALGIRQTGVTIGGMVGALLLPPIALRFGWVVGLDAAAALFLLIVFGFGVFYRNEQPESIDRPLRPAIGPLLRDRRLLVLALYSFVFNGAQGSTVSYLSLFGHQDMGLSIPAAGVLLAMLLAGGSVGRIGWGILSDRMGRRGTIMVGIGALAVVSIFATGFVGPSTPYAVILGLAFLLGLSAVGWNGLYFTAVSEVAGAKAAATALGLGLMATYLGPFVVPPLFGLLADYTHSYQASWLALGAWAIFGTALALVIRRDEKTWRVISE